jgi:predicted ATPase/serine/threonine protein kinase/Tfp pilus assembly protein PilF
VAGDDSARWERIADLFDAAVELAPGERAAFLDERCGGDAGLRGEVEAMLDGHQRAGGILEADVGAFAAEAVSERAPRPSAAGAPPAGTGTTEAGGSPPGPRRRLHVGPYRLLRPAGRGGMGEVWQAFDERLERFVALKFLPRDMAARPDAEARFRDEARAASRLDHPAICTVFDVGEDDDGGLWIAMAYYEGRTLADRLRDGPLPLAEALELAATTARGLGRAHEAGIVHRDVKPSNLMVTVHGELKILDFGVAKLAQGASVVSAADLRVGTLGYMAPEQVRGDRADARSDLFSLGAVLYEMVTGVRPFDRTGASPADVLAAILDREPPPPSRLRPELPRQLDELALRMLAKDPAQRPPSGAAVATELEALRRAVRRWEAWQRSAATPAVAEAGAARPGASSSAAAPPFDSGSTLASWPPPGLPPTTAELRISPLPPARPLPAPLSSFVGREQELHDLDELMRRARLVTLTGPAGSGKSRLALEAARRAADRFAHGARFVPLAAVGEPELVPAAIARALDLSLTLTGIASPFDGLREALGDCDLLLLLDNFEHLLPAAPVVAELLASCPGLHALVTSRTLLRLSGEHTFPVAPLPLPAADAGDIEHLAASPAAVLFLERARAVRPDLEITGDEIGAVAEICIRLEGIPLALELAASRVRLFPPRALRDRLGSRLAWLGATSRDRPERHRTLRAALAWSYDLLGDHEKALFRRMAVFHGGFALEQAAAVAGLGRGAVSAEDGGELIDGLGALVDHSLLRSDDTGEEPRFAMLETMREYGLECLREAGELEPARQQHARALTALAERLQPELTGPHQARHLGRLDRDRANFEAAIAWAQEHGDAELGLRLAASLWRLWLVLGPLHDGGRLAALLALPGGEAPTRLRARALHGVATLLHNLGHNHEARERLAEALAIYRQLGDMAGVAEELTNLAWVACEQSDLDAAVEMSEEALAHQRELGELRGEALSLNNLGWVANYRGRYAEARRFHQASLELRRRIGDLRGEAFALTNLALAEINHGDIERAGALLTEAEATLRPLSDQLLFSFITVQQADVVREREGVEAAARLVERRAGLWRNAGNRSIQVWLDMVAAALDRDLGDAEGAARRLARVVADWEELGSLWGASLARCDRARALLDLGDREAAARETARVLADSRRIGDLLGMACGLEGGVVAGAAAGEEAVRRLGAAAGLRREGDVVARRGWRELVAAAAGRLREEVGEAAFAAAWGAGETGAWEVVAEVAGRDG